MHTLCAYEQYKNLLYPKSEQCVEIADTVTLTRKRWGKPDWHFLSMVNINGIVCNKNQKSMVIYQIYMSLDKPLYPCLILILGSRVKVSDMSR